MSDPHPRVAIPVRLSASADDVRIAAANQAFDDVVAIARAAGLAPVIVSDPLIHLDGFAGVILPGGGDIDPARYGGQQQHPAVYDINPAQDDLDFGIAQAALAAGLPILGICRGLQVLNTLYGGTLHEDLAPTGVIHADVDGDTLAWAWHPVTYSAESALRSATGAEHLPVASGHHQGVRELGAGLRAVAWAQDGLVEAVEDPDHGIVAVQWHPEAAGTDPAVRDAPFTALATAIRVRREATAQTASAHV